MNRVVRHNLRVKHGDIVTVHPCPDIVYVSLVPLFPYERKGETKFLRG